MMWGMTRTPSLILEVQTSSLAGRRFAYSEEQLTEGVTLGRGPECTLRFDANRDLKISSKHALIIRTEDGVMLRDQYSSNGLYLNRQRVRAEGTRLHHDDEISLGYEGAAIRVLLPKEKKQATPKTMIMHGGNPPDVTPGPQPKVPRTPRPRNPRPDRVTGATGTAPKPPHLHDLFALLALALAGIAALVVAWLMR
jgi:predicted component of type VI protein secretion system